MGNFHRRFKKDTVITQRPITNRRKIVMLGSASVGKSSVIHSIKYTLDRKALLNDNFDGFTHIIRRNCVSAILTLWKQSQSIYATNIEIMEQTQLIQQFAQNEFSKKLDYIEIQLLSDAIHKIWNLKQIKDTFQSRLRQKYSFPDNMDHFLNKIHEIMKEDYTPSLEDYTKLDIRSMGTSYYERECSGITYEIWHFGGQRKERKRWRKHFQNVSCIVFVVALNQYCTALFEDESIVGLQESYHLFNEICNLKCFENTEIVLLLNKTDLFRESLQYTPLTFCFDEYNGYNCNDKESGMRMLMKILGAFVENMIIIPIDIKLLICAYMSDLWIDMCYRDGIDFIRKQFVKALVNHRCISTYEVCAIDMNEDEIIKIICDVKSVVESSRILH